MTTTLDAHTSPAGSHDRFRTLLQTQRADTIQQRDEALAECATSVPDPVAQRRSADLHRQIEEIDAALARIEAGTYGRCAGCQAEIPEERLELRPFASTCVACTAAA
ncbi:TraR/DksA family transcriptional regulator [Blastococcus saxobsidens]|uniref:DnaK suppressor protein n=1 Tax=Blastococcus saxobsidens (strain DD2) TaxID=1146883 RepID=H6RLJ0_BLASD|nr:TraR/DksA C4-type zinc finger protein [Blastococcus saxobsidens]CCG02516.1 DnaK suppressor protein [Blastococcus saxobsidens DD2]